MSESEITPAGGGETYQIGTPQRLIQRLEDAAVGGLFVCEADREEAVQIAIEEMAAAPAAKGGTDLRREFNEYDITQDMIQAGRYAANLNDGTLARIYLAMRGAEIAASPTPPAGAAGGGLGDLGALNAGAREAALAVVRAAWALVDNTGYHDLLPLAVNRDDWDELAARLMALKALLPAEELPVDPPHAVAYFWPTEATLAPSAPTPDLGAQGEPTAWGDPSEPGYWTHHQADYLCRRDTESDADWIARLRKHFAPAAPRSGSAVTVEEIARLIEQLQGMSRHWAIYSDERGLASGAMSEAAKILALLQVPRPGETTSKGVANVMEALWRDAEAECEKLATGVWPSDDAIAEAFHEHRREALPTLPPWSEVMENSGCWKHSHDFVCRLRSLPVPSPTRPHSAAQGEDTRAGGAHAQEGGR